MARPGGWNLGVEHESRMKDTLTFPHAPTQGPGVSSLSRGFHAPNLVTSCQP